MSALRPDRLAAVAVAEVGHPWFVARRAMIAGLVARERAPGPGVVVDVGGGTGRTVIEVAAPGDQVLSLDLSGPSATLTSVSACSVQADASALPLPSSGADVVLCCDVLEHLQDDHAAAAELARVLAPTGVAVVTVPAHPALWSFRDDDAGHVRRYTREGLVRVLRGAGLRPTQVSWFAGSTLPAVLALRVAGRRWHGARDVEERVGGGAVGRTVAALLHGEARVVVRGGGPPLGSSLVAVCRQG